ncbi:aldehyde dehydrogenase family protein [Chamaesiphon minutus]|uniref:NAD-dependent aldehyde dehydrogenase n=1 Tax=Chamaesiphon minutus (strain ATCC 27169 / PCC 6605) TaxID=1173020 RepID=K9UAS2_CHAP6|nr:aldehyde dehydrogenase family protein [Chamaesiphon minutus]AFY91940.1 NAD-dependent aldehyde dehydrogenase [Chamaesiphon minutus PCC 6605]
MTATTFTPTTTNFDEIDRAISTLYSHRDNWAQTTILQRLAYLQSCLDRTLAVAEDWTMAACQAKGIDPQSSLAGEELMAGAISTVRNIRLLMTTLEAGGKLSPPKLRQREDGQIVAEVLPANAIERVLYLGYRGEVWLQPGTIPSQGRIYREPTASKVTLILGAGNISAIVAMDALSKLFSENQVVIIKMNPVNAYVGTYIAAALEPLIQAGFVQIVYGGAEVGEYLCQHPQIERIHITGSHRTHDAIVWGATPSEQQERKATNKPRLTKPITSELGCVTPILVVPGKWSPADLTFQARQVASSIAHNASFNCASGQLLVTASGWAQRDEFLAAIRRELAAIPPRQAYYPGAQERYQAFIDRYPQSEPLGTRTPEIVPWTPIPNVPAVAGEYALTEEAFCGILAEVSIESESAVDFLTKVVEFANDRVWGTLSCTVLIDTRTQKQYQPELTAAIANLQYGAIGVNIWSAMLFYFGSTTWGAYPGNRLADIGSGIGFVHNSYLFDRPQKSVVYAPFRIFPTPAWFANHKNLLAMARQLLKFEAYPTWQNLPGVVMAALKG